MSTKQQNQAKGAEAPEAPKQVERPKMVVAVSIPGSAAAVVLEKSVKLEKIPGSDNLLKTFSWSTLRSTVKVGQIVAPGTSLADVEDDEWDDDAEIGKAERFRKTVKVPAPVDADGNVIPIESVKTVDLHIFGRTFPIATNYVTRSTRVLKDKTVKVNKGLKGHNPNVQSKNGARFGAVARVHVGSSGEWYMNVEVAQ